jgi:hypothetical protein
MISKAAVSASQKLYSRGANASVHGSHAEDPEYVHIEISVHRAYVIFYTSTYIRRTIWRLSSHILGRAGEGIGMIDLGGGQGRAGLDWLGAHPQNFVILVENDPENIMECREVMKEHIQQGILMTQDMLRPC